MRRRFTLVQLSIFSKTTTLRFNPHERKSFFSIQRTNFSVTAVIYRVFTFFETLLSSKFESEI